MRSRTLRRIKVMAVAFTTLAMLFAPSPIPAWGAAVTGTSSITLSFSQTPSSGFLSSTPIPLAESVRTVFRTSGVAADQVDGIYAKTITFVASTPQTIDVSALTDIFGNTITAARARLVAIKVKWVTDNVPLLVGGAGANEWDGFLTSGGKVSVFPSSSTNDGFFIISAPQTTGIPINGTSKLLKLDPQTAAGDIDIIIATCSS